MYAHAHSHAHKHTLTCTQTHLNLHFHHWYVDLPRSKITFSSTDLRNSASREGRRKMYARASNLANCDVVSLLNWENDQFQLQLPPTRWKLFAISIFPGHSSNTRYSHPIHYGRAGGVIVRRSWKWSSFSIFMRRTHWQKRFIKRNRCELILTAE